MIGTVNCVYETPCGWCSKWDKECDKKIAERGNRVKCNPVDDAIEDEVKSVLINKMCKSEADHEWECCGISTMGTDYRCKKCGAYKTTKFDYQPLQTFYDSFALDNIPNCCKACPNHPSNGGSGVCNCTAPYFEQYRTVTAIQTSNILKD